MCTNNNVLGLFFIFFVCLATLYFYGFSAIAKDVFVSETRSLAMYSNNTLLPYSQPPEPKVSKVFKVTVTAYSSTPDQTDSTPFITASGKEVAEGIIANNGLPFGACVRLPEIFGDKIFIVEDRMHQRKSDYHFDIWFPNKQAAMSFGAVTTTLEVLAN